jgi:phage/plasmid-associated DNA primase
MLFDVRKMDNWQVMPLMIGEGGTGKSSILDVVDAFFDPTAVCEIDSNFEQKFGLQDKYDKEVVFIRDAPHNLGAVLDQGTFQKMVTGDGMQVSRKNTGAVHVKWNVPMMAASNTMFDYKDNAGQVSRRIVPFWFTKVLSVGEMDGALVDMIKSKELPNVIARCLTEYRKLLADGGWRKSFWAICPPELREAQEESVAAGNMVYRFLRAGPDDSASSRVRTYVVQKKGAFTEWADFKKAFDAYVRYKHPGEKWKLTTDERGPFTKLGYTVVHEHTCKACGSVALVGCCPAYSSANRVKRWRIRDLELVREDVAVADELGI